MQNKTSIDELLNAGLSPDFAPGDDLNGQLIAKLNSADSTKTVRPAKRAKISTITKIVAAAATVALVGAAGTYAASRFITKPQVVDHGIFTGNSDYVDDKVLATMDPTEPQSRGYHTDYKRFATYEEAYKDLSIGATFSTKYELTGEAVTSVTTGPDNYVMRDIEATFKYDEGTFSTYYKKSEGNIAKDVADVILLKNTQNERTYETNGLTFTLVDEVDGDVTKTHTMIKCDEYVGYLRFEGLKDKQIHKILDTLQP